MTVETAGAQALPTNPHTRLDAYCAATTFDKPTLVLDVDLVEQQYHALKAGLGHADIHYAVKANPAEEIISRLVKLGSHFDAASKAEIALCLKHGANPDDVSFGNTVKRSSDIAWAHEQGITLFSADAEQELEKIAVSAPNAKVYIRLIVEVSQADWPLSRKFGCDSATAIRLLSYAKSLGLDPIGFSFHVGSQTRKAAMWGPSLDALAEIWHTAKKAGHNLTLLNIGGGFPIKSSLSFEWDYEYMAEGIVETIKKACDEEDLPHPNLFTEFGSFTVGENEF